MPLEEDRATVPPAKRTENLVKFGHANWLTHVQIDRQTLHAHHNIPHTAVQGTEIINGVRGRKQAETVASILSLYV